MVSRNILCITSSANLGLYRLMKVLKTRGFNIYLLIHNADYEATWGLGNNIFNKIYPFPSNLYNPTTQYLNLNKAKSLINEIIINNKIDLIYSVNIYNDFLSFVASSLKSVPVIYVVVDMHSLMSNHLTIRNPLKSARSVFGRVYANFLEKQSYRLSAGYVFSTQNMEQAAASKYRIDTSNSVILSNYLPHASIVAQGQKKLSELDNELHLVHEGSIAMTGHNFILPAILSIAKRNVHVHLYCNEVPDYYVKAIGDNPYIHWQKYMKLDDLIYELTKYDYGLMVYNDTERKHLDSVLPNKLFDYLAAGLPVLSPPFKSLKYFIENNQVGIVFENIEDLLQNINSVNYAKLATNVMNVRQNLTMEGSADNVIGLFEKVWADRKN